VRTRFGEFYAALFDRTIEKNPGAVVTEYAWDASTCDPCPGPQLDGGDFATLGADVLGGAGAAAVRATLTRLHARYGKTVTPRTWCSRRRADRRRARAARRQRQARGAVASRTRTARTTSRRGTRSATPGPGRSQCKRTRGAGVWGGPPSGVTGGGVKPALDLAFAPRGQAKLPELVRQDVPELEVKAAAAAVGGDTSVANPPPGATPPPGAKTDKKSGCGCDTDGRGGATALAGGLGVAALLRLRRRRR
jgi:MYXO-CTERM domain-containing protein